MKSCMGGWCGIRERCQHYERRGPNAAERLCVKGKDGTPRRPTRLDLAPLVPHIIRIVHKEAA